MERGGTIITLDINEELEERVRKNFQDAGMEDRVDYRIGNALKIIPGINEVFDLVFIDADKENYGNYFDLVIDEVRPGGFILADNAVGAERSWMKNRTRIRGRLTPLRAPWAAASNFE